MSNYKVYIRDSFLVERLERIHDKKYELKKLIDNSDKKIPYIVELSGLPRTGKSETTRRVQEFFKAAKINISCTTEPAQIIKDTQSAEEISKLTNLQFNNMTLEISRNQLEKLKQEKADIILQDRGVIDNYFWYQMMYDEGTINDEQYERILLNLANDLTQTDQLFVLYAKPEIIVFRDYMNSIYLEERKKTTKERVEKLRQGFEKLIINSRINRSKKLTIIDTSDTTELDTAITIADKIMDGMTKKLVK